MTAPQPAARLSHWWQGAQFTRFVADVLMGTLARSRPGATLLRRQEHASGLDFQNLGIDSLERLRLATALIESLQFPTNLEPDRFQEAQDFSGWVAEARRGLKNECRSIGFRTSGSTGAPSLIVHGFDVLAQEIEFLAGLLGDRTRIVSLIPSHHIYGFLFTVLLPLRLSAPVLDARAHAPQSIRELVAPGDLIVAVPAFWQLAAETGLDWPAGVDGVTSGAPCPQPVAAAMTERGLRRLVEVYGTSETGGIGWRDVPTAPYRLMPFWKRLDGDRITKQCEGRAYTFELPDNVAWHGADLLEPLSRRDGAVQVAGMNVYPEIVRAVLMAHPRVAEAQVRLMCANEGERLKAFVVPRVPEDCGIGLRTELETWVDRRLQTVERPRSYTFGPKLPRNELGKLADWPIKQIG